MPSTDSVSTRLSALKERAIDKVIALGTKVLIYGSYLGLTTMVTLKFWPQKHYSEKFFEVGKLYKFRANNVWYTLWTEEKDKVGNINRNTLYRMKPGTVFMVLSTKPNIPTSLEVEVLVDEKRARFSIEGEQSIQPWQFFDRIQLQAETRDTEGEDDLP